VLATAVRASQFHIAGDQVPEQTDRAVLEGARRVDVSAEGEWGRVEHLSELPFASDRAYHATLWRDRRGEWISVKGAPEVVLPLCSTWRRANRTVALTAPEHTCFTAQVDRLARQVYRLAVAERAMAGQSGLAESDMAELELRGMVALAHPVRATSARAVATLRAAGVATVIITGTTRARPSPSPPSWTRSMAVRCSAGSPWMSSAMTSSMRRCRARRCSPGSPLCRRPGSCDGCKAPVTLWRSPVMAPTTCRRSDSPTLGWPSAPEPPRRPGSRRRRDHRRPH
jgi:hypothetical protein